MDLRAGALAGSRDVRAAAAALVTAWALSQRHAFGVLASLGPVALFAVELTQPKGTLEDTWRKVQRRARLVAKAHRARAVVFGHTHMPEGHWEEGVFFGNTGSWSAAYKDVACKEPLFDERLLVWLRVHRRCPGIAPSGLRPSVGFPCNVGASAPGAPVRAPAPVGACATSGLRPPGLRRASLRGSPHV